MYIVNSFFTPLDCIGMKNRGQDSLHTPFRDPINGSWGQYNIVILLQRHVEP